MKRTNILKLISLTLVILMLLGAFAACGIKENGGETTGGNVSESETEDGTLPESEKNEESNVSSEEGSESDAEESTSESESETEANASISDIENGLFIENADALKNRVNAYFTDENRTDFAVENLNSKLEYALSAGKAQQITSIVNTNGNAYIQNTSDVFIKMAGGDKLYASASTKPATANLYRFGYYSYEARFEEQNFFGVINEDDSYLFSIKTVLKQQVKTSYNEELQSLRAFISNTEDPYIEVRNVNFDAADYQYLAITVKADVTSARGVVVYLATDSHAMGASEGIIISPSDEYLTYYIPIHRTSWYKGTVNRLRIDFEGSVRKGDVYEFKDIRLVSSKTDGIPEKIGLNRSFYVYSDKMHQVVQFASADVATENIESLGFETKISKSTVSKVVVKDDFGVHNSFDEVDWDTAEYVGFDITDAGIFGYILPAGERTDRLEVTDDGENYVIIQSRTPEGGKIRPSGVWNASKKAYDALANDNANDLYMGHRIYTDESHDFEKFLLEAEIERNPLTDKNFIINKHDSSYTCTYECSSCRKVYQEYFTKCQSCGVEAAPVEHPTVYFVGYNALRGIYSIYVPSEGFNAPYFQYPNKYINATFVVKGDEYDRSVYLMTEGDGGCLECAVVLDENKMLLPIPIQVGKNFSEATGERNLWNIQDNEYSEAIIPMKILANSKQSYTVLNLYQNWGQYPLKQVSWIQYGAPYYHLSTGVTETNCIVPYYSCKNNRGLATLPDHRAMSAHLWGGQPQHTSGGSHRWLIYTDADGVYSASENTLDYIDSYGPIYADVYMDFISDDGKIKVSYVHTEFPQTDENRAFYEMKYEVLEDISFKNFAEDFFFYSVTDNDSKGSYISVGYLNENNRCTVADAAKNKESFKYTLGTECPYFSFFNMPDYDRNSSSAEGYVNLSFLIYNYEFVINGEKSDARFAIINEDNHVNLSLDLAEVTLKAGDSFTINAIVMPWGDENVNYAENGDKNVRDVRENTLLNPLTPVAVENCEVMESVFLPKVRSTNGKNATFTLKGGENNVAVRVYGFKKLTAPKIQELVDGEWVDYQVSSAYKPDRFGNAYYYDGYSVHYDGDGTFSYSFIVPMDYTDADGRTLRISAEEDFDEWPRELPKVETDAEELPMNVLVGAEDIMNAARSQAGSRFGGISMSADGSYVTLSSNSSVTEAYFNIWMGDGGRTVTGQYLVLKYRLPETNNKEHAYFEYFTKTEEGIPTSQSCFGVSNALIWDGQWHTLAVDVSSWNKECYVATDGVYKAQFVRIDLFNNHYEDGNSIDIEFFATSDNIEDVLAYYSVDTLQVLTYKNSIVSYDKQGNVIGDPAEKPEDKPEEKPEENPEAGSKEFTKYLDASAVSSAAKAGSHTGENVISNDNSYVTMSLDVTSGKNESYFNIFSDNTSATGQYLVVKYRTESQVGYFEFYASTVADGAAAAQGIGGYFVASAEKGLYVRDGEWHVIVIDLSKALKETAFAANDAGEYVAKFVRVDLFNLSKSKIEECSVDIAYIGMCDSYEAAISHSDTTLFYDTELKVVDNAGN